MSLWERAIYQGRRKRHHWLPDSRDKAYKAHTLAIGQLAIQWNLLHEAMGFLFLSLLKGGHSNQYAEVWSSNTSDRSKREMLLAAADGMWIDPDAQEERLRHSVAQGLVKKLVGAASALEDTRNNAIHAPLRWGQMCFGTTSEPSFRMSHWEMLARNVSSTRTSWPSSDGVVITLIG
jgi:hypothetical protein